MVNNGGNERPKFERKYYGHDHKKPVAFKSPDIRELQEVIIDDRTKMYIALGASPEEARKRYFERLEAKRVPIAVRKPAAKPAVAVTEPIV